MARKCNVMLSQSIQMLRKSQMLAQQEEDHIETPEREPSPPPIPERALQRKSSLFSFLGLTTPPASDSSASSDDSEDSQSIALKSLQRQSPVPAVHAYEAAQRTLSRVKSQVSDLFRRYVLHDGLNTLLPESYYEWRAQSMLKIVNTRLEELNQAVETQTSLIDRHAQALHALRQAFCQYLDEPPSDPEVSSLSIVCSGSVTADQDGDFDGRKTKRLKVSDSKHRSTSPEMKPAPPQNVNSDTNIEEDRQHEILNMSIRPLSTLSVPFLHAILSGIALDILDATQNAVDGSGRRMSLDALLRSTDPSTSLQSGECGADLFREYSKSVNPKMTELLKYKEMIELGLEARGERMVRTTPDILDDLDIPDVVNSLAFAERFCDESVEGNEVQQVSKAGYAALPADVGPIDFTSVYLSLFSVWTRHKDKRSVMTREKLDLLEQRERARMELDRIEHDRAESLKREQDALAEKRKRVAATMPFFHSIKRSERVSPPPPPPSSPEPPTDEEGGEGQDEPDVIGDKRLSHQIVEDEPEKGEVGPGTDKTPPMKRRESAPELREGVTSKQRALWLLQSLPLSRWGGRKGVRRGSTGNINLPSFDSMGKVATAVEECSTDEDGNVVFFPVNVSAPVTKDVPSPLGRRHLSRAHRERSRSGSGSRRRSRSRSRGKSALERRMTLGKSPSRRVTGKAVRDVGFVGEEGAGDEGEEKRVCEISKRVRYGVESGMRRVPESLERANLRRHSSCPLIRTESHHTNNIATPSTSITLDSTLHISIPPVAAKPLVKRPIAVPERAADGACGPAPPMSRSGVMTEFFGASKVSGAGVWVLSEKEGC
ncbi:hypothetical protein HDV00_008157 [Rhizophlyctis rosea]|nr:hypothetical protein HDV00_008157 [Rhizophlyctis rosea]